MLTVDLVVPPCSDEVLSALVEKWVREADGGDPFARAMAEALQREAESRVGRPAGVPMRRHHGPI